MILDDELALSTELIAENREISEIVRKAIDELAETPRTLILLRDIEGYTTEEVSELLDLSMSNVKTGLHRARKQVMKRLKKHDTLF